MQNEKKPQPQSQPKKHLVLKREKLRTVSDSGLLLLDAVVGGTGDDWESPAV